MDPTEAGSKARTSANTKSLLSDGQDSHQNTANVDLHVLKQGLGPMSRLPESTPLPTRKPMPKIDSNSDVSNLAQTQVHAGDATEQDELSTNTLFQRGRRNADSSTAKGSAIVSWTTETSQPDGCNIRPQEPVKVTQPLWQRAVTQMSPRSAFIFHPTPKPRSAWKPHVDVPQVIFHPTPKPRSARKPHVDVPHVVGPQAEAEVECSNDEASSSSARFARLEERSQEQLTDARKNVQFHITSSGLIESETKSELTMLLLGDTGVGKSTTINGFVQTLRFFDLAVAENANLDLPVPATVSVNESGLDGQIEFRNISCGHDENEQYRNYGQSVTQRPKIYTVTNGNREIKIVDTPGMNDTRNTTGNMEQDDLNVEYIIAKLAEIDRLDAVIILLGPTQTRMSSSFVNLFKKILTNLSSDVKNNIIFLVTNAMNCSFQPSGSIHMLKAFLTENNLKDIPLTTSNVFFVDNRAVPYLIKYRNECAVWNERNQVELCWNESALAYMKMMKYTQTLTPIEMESIKALKKVQLLIDCIARLLQELTTEIGLCEKQLTQKIEEAKELKEKMTTATLAERSKLINQLSALVQKMPYVRKGLKQEHYSLICHQCNVSQHNCWIPRVCQERVTIAFSPRLCQVMKWGKCQHPLCGEHEAARHEIVNMIFFESPDELSEGEKALTNKLRDMIIAPQTNMKAGVEAAEMEIEILKKKADYIRSELQQLLTSVAKLTNFQRDNCLASKELLADVIVKGIDEKIGASKLMADELKINVLQEVKEKYQSALRTETSQRRPVAEIEAVINNLFSLPRSGALLEQVAEACMANMRLERGSNEAVEIKIAGKKADSFYQDVFS